MTPEEWAAKLDVGPDGLMASPGEIAYVIREACGAAIREALVCPDCGGTVELSCGSEPCLLKAFDAAPPWSAD